MKESEIDKNQDVHEFLKRNPCAILATASEGSAPDLAHVFIHLDIRFTGYFMSKLETRKIENIFANPDVNLMFSDSDSLQQVEYRGIAKTVEDTEAIAKLFPKVIETIQSKRPDYWMPPLAQIKGDGYCLVEVTPMSIVYRDYAREEKDTGPNEYKVKIPS